MFCELLTKNKRVESESPPAPGADDESGLRSLALQQIERVRNLKLHVAAFAVGAIMLGGMWVLIDYGKAGGWPERLSDEGQPGDWSPWIPAVLIVWALFLAIRILKFHFRRPPTERELQREIERQLVRERGGKGRTEEEAAR